MTAPWRGLACALLTVLLAAVATSAGRPGGAAVAEGAATPVAAAPARGGTARVGLLKEPATFVDWNAGTVQDLMIADLVFRRLARPGAEPGAFVPDLAESWEVLPDKRSLRFRLRQGVLWEDGKEVTAADVVFTEERACSGSSLATYKRLIESVEAVGDREVVFRYKRAYPGMLRDAVLGHVYPAHLLRQLKREDLVTHPFNRKPVGSGPFRLDRWEATQYLAFVPRDGAGGALLDRVVLRIFADKDAAIREMEGGGLDYLRKVPKETYDRLVGSGKFRGFRFPTREYLFVAWNTKRPPWDRPEVRLALTALIDRRAIAMRFEGEGAAVAEGPVPPGDPLHDPRLISPAFDVERAKGKLASAGLKRSPEGRWLDPKGAPLRVVLLSIGGNALHQDAAALVADALRRAGFEAEVRGVEVGQLRARVAGGEFDGALFVRSDKLPVDLATCFGSKGDDNWAGLADPEIDRLVAEEASVPDPAKAREAFDRAYRRVIELQPWTFLFYRSEASVFHPRLHGLDANPRDPFAFADRWWIPRDRQ